MCRMRYPKWMDDELQKLMPYLKLTNHGGEVVDGVPEEMYIRWEKLRKARREYFDKNRYY